MIKLQFMFHLNSNPERIWGCIIKIDNLKLAQHFVKDKRAVAQITLASIIHTVYKNGKYNLNGVLP